MFLKFSEECQKVFLESKKEMDDLKHYYIGTEHLLLSILKSKNYIAEIFNNNGVTYNNFRSEIIRLIGIGNKENKWSIYTPLLKRIIENAILISKEENISEVCINHLIISLIEEGDGKAIRILKNLDVDIDNVYDDICNNYNKHQSNKKLFVDEFGYDLNKKVLEKKTSPVFERNDEVNKLIEIICRKCKNNPLLIGEAGVGKTAIVEELANRINNGDVPIFLKNKRLISVEMASLVAGTKYRGEFEERIVKLIKEVENNDDIILFIDEIHTIIGAGGAEGAIDASNILKPALSRGKIKIIGATTNDEYKKTIEKDKAFERRFQKIFIEEPNLDKTYKILKGIKGIYEDFHGVKITDDLLHQIVNLTDKYIYNRFQPDKSIDILDEVCVKCSLLNNKNNNKIKEYNNELNKIILNKKNAIKENDYHNAFLFKEKEQDIKKKIKRLNNINLYKNNEISLDMIKEVIYSKTSIPIYDFNNKNNDLFLLKNKLSKVVIGQDNAIQSLINITKRITYGFKDNKRPNSLLFLGNTGTGKTLLAKEYAKEMFGNNKFIRIDMSEYKEAHSISKLIGAPSGYIGYEDNSNRFEEIRNNPHCVLLLDEIEKANKAVINLFLQILDEGFIKDNLGRTIRFDNVVIIMTSNVGSSNNIGFNEESSSLLSKLKEHFNLEFINRIDNVILFNKLTEDDVKKIIKNKICDLKNKMKNRNIKLSISNKIMEDILKELDYINLGARQIDKIFEKKIYNLVIDELSGGKDKIIISSL